jgi:hypothetical protein
MYAAFLVSVMSDMLSGTRFFPATSLKNFLWILLFNLGLQQLMCCVNKNKRLRFKQE